MKSSRYITIALFAVAILTAAFFGCDNRVFEADDFEIQWITAPDTLYSNVEANIRVLVTTKKTKVPAPNQTVTFKTDRGEIQATAETNEFGVATAKFSHNSRSLATARIEAYIHQSEVTASVVLQIHPGEYVIRKITATPKVIYNDNNVTRSAVRVLVVDSEGIGAVGQVVSFKAFREEQPSSTRGKVTSTAVTDSSGVARATFADNGDLGKAVVQAMIDQSTDTTHVQIKDAMDLEFDLHLTRYPARIYADNNVSSSTITARVRDHLGFPVSGATVRFRASIGHIAASVMTDERGIAVVEFFDGGEVGTAEIRATVNDVEATVYVEVSEVPTVHEVNFASFPVSVSLEATFTLSATAVDTAGVGLVKGSIMVFEATKGGFQVGEDEALVEVVYADTDDRGRASVRWSSGTSAGDVHFTAYIMGTEPRANAESYITPGLPERIRVTSMVRMQGEQFWRSMPAALPVDFQQQNNAIRVFAYVVDMFDNPVSDGIPIMFDTDLGTIHPIKPTETFTLNVWNQDAQQAQPRQFKGVAWSVFTMGASAGTAAITAMTMDEEIIGITTIRIESYDIRSISFVQEEEIFLDVRGVGGVESRQLIVHLKDFSGNLVADPPAPELPPMVEFDILAPYPSGVTINNIGTSASVRSNNGVASASIISGEDSGTVRIRVRLADNQTIQAIKSNIVVRSGPPASIQPFIPEFDQAVNIGGGMWRLNIGAVVKDRYGNEAINGTVVHFSLEGAPPDTEVRGAGFVGNESDENEDGDPGIAWTHLFYHGRNTNEPFTIVAKSGEIEGEVNVIVPITAPNLEVAPSVGQVRFFSTGGRPQEHYVEIVATVTDGQGVDIRNQVVELVASQGDIVYHGLAQEPFRGHLPRYLITHEGGVQHPMMPPNDPPQNWTDGEFRPPHTTLSIRGRAYGVSKVYINELPPPDEEWFTQVDNQITVRLIGTDTIAQTSFTIIRYHAAVPPFR